MTNDEALRNDKIRMTQRNPTSVFSSFGLPFVIRASSFLASHPPALRAVLWDNTLMKAGLLWFANNAFPLYLAPMAGVTDKVFRQICKGYGADVLVTEFVSAEGVFRC